MTEGKWCRKKVDTVWLGNCRVFRSATTVGKRLKDDIHFIATGCWEGVYARRVQGGLFPFALALAHSMCTND